MIKDKYKVIFCHIPRTSGHSISNFFDYSIANLPKTQRLPRHAPLQDYKNRYQKEYPVYTKFTFVRNPLDRLVSAYLRCWKMYYKENPMNLNHLDDIEFFTKVKPMFNQFIKNDLEKFYLRSHFRPTVLWINESNFNEFDFIGRFEYLEEDLNRLAKICKMKSKSIVHLSKSHRREFEVYYNRFSLKKVKEIYKKDFEIFKKVNELFT